METKKRSGNELRDIFLYNHKKEIPFIVVNKIHFEKSKGQIAIVLQKVYFNYLKIYVMNRAEFVSIVGYPEGWSGYKDFDMGFAVMCSNPNKSFQLERVYDAITDQLKILHDICPEVDGMTATGILH